MNSETNFMSDYKQNSKEFHFEEPFDYLVFRPLAYLVLKLVDRLEFLTPNHFSLVGLIIALASGFFLSTGTSHGFVLGGVGIFIFSVLDCCDGMLARMKNNGSKYGELIDMFVDLLASISYYFGLYFGLGKTGDFFPIQYFALFSGGIILIHVSIYNYFKKQYYFYEENNPKGREREYEKYRRELEALKKEKGHYFQKMLLRMFLIFSRAQKKTEEETFYPRDKYLTVNKSILPLWGGLAGSTHLMILSLSLMSHRVGLYFLYSLVFSNIWLLFVSFIQFNANRGIEG